MRIVRAIGDYGSRLCLCLATCLCVSTIGFYLFQNRIFAFWACFLHVLDYSTRAIQSLGLYVVLVDPKLLSVRRNLVCPLRLQLRTLLCHLGLSPGQWQSAGRSMMNEDSVVAAAGTTGSVLRR